MPPSLPLALQKGDVRDTGVCPAHTLSSALAPDMTNLPIGNSSGWIGRNRSDDEQFPGSGDGLRLADDPQLFMNFLAMAFHGAF